MRIELKTDDDEMRSGKGSKKRFFFGTRDAGWPKRLSEVSAKKSDEGRKERCYFAFTSTCKIKKCISQER